MNDTAPLQKQDLDRVTAALEAIVTELRSIRGYIDPSSRTFRVPRREAPLSGDAVDPSVGVREC